jgi:collagenase-like protein with putative collagen-binding domain
MLFQGWSSAKSWLGGKPWRGHPYHPDNNVQRFNGNKAGDTGPALDDPHVRERQAAYIRKVIDTLNDLDNVLYEVTNEGGYKEWDLFVVNTVHDYEKTKPKQHPVGLTGHGSENNDEMVASPADWFSPGSNQWPDLKTDPRAVDGKKVSLLDTDHVFGVGGDQKWVWKAFLRGHNVLFMDPYDDPAWAPILAGQGVSVRDAEACRRAMGLTRRYASQIDLGASRPAGEMASTGYCLSVPGREYLVYLPDGGNATVDLSSAKGKLTAEWIHPITGKVTPSDAVEGGGKRTLKAPFAGDAVLLLRATH